MKMVHVAPHEPIETGIMRYHRRLNILQNGGRETERTRGHRGS